MSGLSIQHIRRDLGLASVLAQAAVTKLHRPLKLTVCLTFRCHHRCASCGIWQRDKGVEMTAAQLDSLFASVPDLRWLDLTGGEVVVRRDLAQIAASIRRHLPRLAMLHFPTAGWSCDDVLTAADALSWRPGPRLVLTVSIDGPRALHDQIRGVNGAWDRAVETLVKLRERGYETYPGMTLQPGNIAAVDATVDALADVLPGFSHAGLHVNVAHTSPHYFDNERCATATTEQITEAISTLRRSKGRAGDPIEAIEALYLALLPAHLRHGRSPIPCRSGELSAYIGPDGEVFACTIDPRPIGHLRDYDWDLGSLWEGDARARLAAEIADDRCVGCWTPCEAYQSLLASPSALIRGLATARVPDDQGAKMRSRKMVARMRSPLRMRRKSVVPPSRG